MSLPTFGSVSHEAGSALLSAGALLIKHQASTAKEAESTAIAAWRQAGFNYGLGDYNEGGSVVRSEVEPGVYDVAAGAPADKVVGAHCEKAYQASMPHFVAFACFRAADQGGELQLIDVKKATSLLPAPLLDKLQRLGVIYLRRMGDSELTPDWSYATGTWQQRLGTSDLAAARRLLRESYGALAGEEGATLEQSADGTVMMKWRASALAKLPGGGADRPTHEEFAVHSILDNHRSMNYGEGESPLHSQWGDGSEFMEEELAALRAAVDGAECVRQRLEPGDVIVVDNFRFAHGRLPFSGPRKHVALMSEDVPRGIAAPALPQ